MSELGTVDDHQRVRLCRYDRIGRFTNTPKIFGRRRRNSSKPDNRDITERKQARHAFRRHVGAADAGKMRLPLCALPDRRNQRRPNRSPDSSPATRKICESFFGSGRHAKDENIGAVRGRRPVAPVQPRWSCRRRPQCPQGLRGRRPRRSADRSTANRNDDPAPASAPSPTCRYRLARRTRPFVTHLGYSRRA